MDKTYLLTALDFCGIRRPLTTATSRSNLAAIADKLVTAHVKDGFNLTEVVEADDVDASLEGHLERHGPTPYKVYVLVKPAKRKNDTPDNLVRLELYELPIDTESTYKVDLFEVWNF